MSEHMTIRWVNWLRQQHRSVCFENGWDAEEQGTAYGEGADALEAVGSLRDKVAEQSARIEALEAERDAAVKLAKDQAVKYLQDAGQLIEKVDAQTGHIEALKAALLEIRDAPCMDPEGNSEIARAALLKTEGGNE